MNLFNLGWKICFSGGVIIFFSVFILGDENGDGQVDNIALMYLGAVPLLIGGLIVIYCRITGQDDDDDDDEVDGDNTASNTEKWKRRF